MKTSDFKIYTRVRTSIAYIPVLALFFCVQQAVAQSYNPSQVVIDPGNKKNIRGNIQIAQAWAERLSTPPKLRRGIINLKEAMNRYTKIQTNLDKHLMLSSQKLLQMPFVYVTCKGNFDLTETEKRNVRRYFENGGFMVVENPNPFADTSSGGGGALKKMIRETIPNARFQPIPNSHPLYHCFFPFTDGPPQGAELGKLTGFGGEQQLNKHSLLPKKVFILEGVWYKGRLAAVYSDKAYIVKWNDYSNNEPQLKMGVNMIVFALTQEGSIVKKQ